MSSITITFKDGTVRNFQRENRPGGSYSKKLEFEIGFAVVVDEYYCRRAFPASDIKEIFEVPDRY